MKESGNKSTKWVNPLTIVLFSLFVIYVVICIDLASMSTASNRGFIDYIAVLSYPIVVPYHAVTHYLQLLDTPKYRHSWQWHEFGISFLLISLLLSICASVFSKNSVLRKLSIGVGIPLVIIWYSGALIIIFLSSIH